MKKRLYTGLLALVLMFSMTACGKPAENPNPEQGTQGTENVDSSEKNEKPENSDILGGIYSGGDTLVEIPFGSTINGEATDIFTVKVPENYWCGAFYNDAEGKEHTADMANGNDEVKKAIENGLLTLDGKIHNLALYSTDGSSTTILYVFAPYTEEENYEVWKNSSKDYKVIENDKHEAFYYESQDEYVVFIYDLGEIGVIQANFHGKLKDKIGVDQIAQSLYDLITVIE